MAMQALNQLAGGDISPTEWEAAKDRILRQVEAGKAENYRSLLEDLLARMPEQRSQVIYGAEMITTIILGLNQSGHRRIVRPRQPAQADRQLGEFGRHSRVGMGLAMVERVNRRLARFLLLGIGRFRPSSRKRAENRRQRLRPRCGGAGGRIGVLLCCFFRFFRIILLKGGRRYSRH